MSGEKSSRGCHEGASSKFSSTEKEISVVKSETCDEAGETEGSDTDATSGAKRTLDDNENKCSSPNFPKAESKDSRASESMERKGHRRSCRNIPSVLERLRKSSLPTPDQKMSKEVQDESKVCNVDSTVCGSVLRGAHETADVLRASTKTVSKTKAVELQNLDNILSAQEVVDSSSMCPDTRNSMLPVQGGVCHTRLHLCDVCHKEFSSRRVLFKHQKTHLDVHRRVSVINNDSPSTQNEELAGVDPFLNVEFPSEDLQPVHLTDLKTGSTPKQKPVHAVPVRSIDCTKKPLTCDICLKGFSTRKTLNRHRRNIHCITSPAQKTGAEDSSGTFSPTQGEHSKPFSCDICHKGFSTRKTLGKHRRNIHSVFRSSIPVDRCENLTGKSCSASPSPKRRSPANEKPFACEVCEKRFLRSKNLKAHERIHTNEKTYRCEWCPKAFHRNGDLKVHKRLHTGEKPYQCDQCPKAFSHVGHFAIHKRVHAGEKPFECKYCSKTFFRSGNLYSHLKVHTGEKTFKCEFCLLKFATLGELTVHKIIHDGVRRYRCKVCSKTFSSRSHLTVHKRIHSGDKRFKCEMCSKSFYRSDTLVSHIKTHTGDKVFLCDFCPVSLATKGQLAYHMRTSHSIETEDSKELEETSESVA